MRRNGGDGGAAAPLRRWLRSTPWSPPQDFLEKLRDIYGRPEMKVRFPNGL